MADGPVLVADHGPARVLTLARPDARNAMDSALLAALLEAVAEALRTDGVAVLVFTGAGGAFFSSAALLEHGDHDARVRCIDLLGEVCEAVGTSPLPTVAPHLSRVPVSAAARS